MAGIKPQKLQLIVQTLFVVIGCDYSSFFSQPGKAKFLDSFFQYCSFITSGCNAQTPGTLADTDVEDANINLGFLAFLRLLGVVYFKKHLRAFDVDIPLSHFRRFTQQDTAMKCHSAWLETIRQTIWSRITYENELLPTDSALLLHALEKIMLGAEYVETGNKKQ